MRNLLIILNCGITGVLGNIAKLAERPVQITPHPNPSAFLQDQDISSVRKAGVHPDKDIKKQELTSDQLALQERMVRFVGWLRSYASEDQFNINGFAYNIKWMEEQLAQINFSLDTTAPSPKLAHQFWFLNYMFSLMCDNVKCLRFYNLTSREEALVNSVAQLNLRILALHDALGKPSSEVAALDEEVVICIKYLKHWRAALDSSPDLPDSVRRIVGNQLQEANRQLRDLLFAGEGSMNTRYFWRERTG